MNTAVAAELAEAQETDSATLVGTFENLFRLESTETTELIMVRHAEPDYNATNGTAEPPDPPLTLRGRLQAVRLAERLQEMQIDAIYSSTMRRAIDTASVIAEAKGLPIMQAPQLREVAISPRVLNNGANENPKRFASEVLLRSLNNPRWDAIEGLEASRPFRHRVVEAVDGIISRHPGERVVLVTHAGVINAYLTMILDIPRDMFFLPEHASISVVRVLRDLFAVRNLNDYAHLLPNFSRC